MRKRFKILLLAGLLFIPFGGKGLERLSGNGVSSAQTSSKPRVLQVNLRSEINGYSWLLIQKSLTEAAVNKYNCVLLVLNTYGGEVLYADSIRTKILNAKIPVYVFIDNNAASAGALTSIACDKIFMRTSGAIGASTVVDRSTISSSFSGIQVIFNQYFARK